MYLFIVFILFINIFLMSKVIVFLLEFLLMCVILPLINFSNKLNQTKYYLELHKIMIPDDENGWNFEISDDKEENEEEENEEEENEEEENDEEENDIKLNDFTFIDNKLD
jgi:hypothetical protein